MGSPATPAPELEALGHDVRLDGVSFWRIHTAAGFRRCLEPGAVVYFVAVVRGSLTLHVHFPDQETILLTEGDAVSLSGMTQHVFEAGRMSADAAGAERFELRDFAEGRDATAEVQLMVGIAPHEAMSLANMINGPLVIRQQHDVEYSRHIWRAFEFLEDEYAGVQMHFDRDQIVRRMAEIMSININRAISQRDATRMRRFTARRSRAYDSRMRGIWRSLARFLEQPFETWTIDRLARVAGVSRTVYCESFRESTGMTPRKSLGRIRLALIARRLAQDRLPLEEAAEIAGYGSAAAFVRAFQREFGQTPARWRKAQHK